MNRPQLTLSLLLGAMAWSLSAMPTPRATLAADARDLISVRACGWLDLEAGSWEAPWGIGDFDDLATPWRTTDLNTLRFRVVPAPSHPAAADATEAAPIADRSPAAEPKEAILRLRATATDEADDSADAPVVWIIPGRSLWTDRPSIEAAVHLGFAITGNVAGAAATSAPGAPNAATRQTADLAASVAWLGDRCPILMRVAPGLPVARPSDHSRPTTARALDPVSTVAATLSGLSLVLEDWSSRLERLAQAAHEARDASLTRRAVEPADSAAARELLELTGGVTVLGL